MWRFLTIGFVAIAVAKLSQIAFLFNADVLNGSLLTGIGVGVGCFSSVSLAIRRRVKWEKESYVVHDVYKPNKVMAFVNWPFTVFVLIALSMIGISIFNRALPTADERVVTFEVVSVSSKVISHDRFLFIELRCEEGSVRHVVESANAYKVGDLIAVKSA